jgi:hypothetical protein
VTNRRGIEAEGASGWRTGPPDGIWGHFPNRESFTPQLSRVCAGWVIARSQSRLKIRPWANRAFLIICPKTALIYLSRKFSPYRESTKAKRLELIRRPVCAQIEEQILIIDDLLPSLSLLNIQPHDLPPDGANYAWPKLLLSRISRHLRQSVPKWTIQ